MPEEECNKIVIMATLFHENEHAFFTQTECTYRIRYEVLILHKSETDKYKITDKSK